MKLKQYLTLLLLLLGIAAWGETITEGFEHATTSTNYQSTRIITQQSSDCGISWEIYYGSATTTDAISGNNSVQLRYYSNGIQGNIHTTTPIEGLTNVSFNAKVSNQNLKINIGYSENGSDWIYLETHKELTTTVTNYSFDIPQGGKYFKVSISSNSTTPSSGKNYQFIIDDVVFTYGATPVYSFTAASSNSDYGTVLSEGNVITATPAYGYRVTTTNPCTISPEGAATVTPNGDNTFTVSNLTANCTITINFEKIPVVTAVSSPDNYGTVSVSGNVITATPAEGYRVSESNPYNVISGEATVVQSGNTFTVTATADCTIQINFEEIPVIVTTKIFVKSDYAPYIYTWKGSGESEIKYNGVWPGTQMSETWNDDNGVTWYTIDIPATGFNMILNNGFDGDSNKTGDINNITEKTYFVWNSSDDGYSASQYQKVQLAEVTVNDLSVNVGATENSPVSTDLELSLNYRSDDTSIATVASDGKVTGVSEGTATITVWWGTQPVPQDGNTYYAGGSKTFTVMVGLLRTYQKITSTDDIEAGKKYLIVYEPESVAFDGRLTDLDQENNCSDVTISDNQISTIQDIYFTIDGNTNSYTIRSASGYYIGRTASSNGLNVSTTTAYNNSISFDEDGNANINANIESEVQPYLKFNSTSNQKRFRYYSSGQDNIQLYKGINPEVTIYVKADEAPYIYTWTGDGETPTEYTGNWPGRKAAKTTVVNGVTWYTLTVPALGFNLILNNGNSGKINQTDDIEDIREDTYYVWNSSDDGYAANQYLAVKFTNVSASDVTVREGGTTDNPVSAKPERLSLSYSSSDETIATVDNDGNVTGVAAGTATITVSWETQVVDGQGYLGGSITYTVTVDAAPASGDFVKATSVNDLLEGMQVIIVNEENNRVMGIQKENNFGASPVTIITNTEGTPYQATLVDRSDVTVLTLEQSGDYWCFKDNKGYYLYAASSSKNYLKTEKTADDNAKASITIGNDDNNNATIIFQGTNSRNIIRFNANNAQNEEDDLFSCYETGQKPVQIYYRGTITLKESEDNSTIISKALNKTQSVNLYRQLTADMWNAICLPFDVNEANMKKLFGEGYLLRTFSGVEKNGNNVTLMFGEATTIEAGVPYIVLPTQSVERNVMKVFANVTLTNGTPTVVTKEDAEGNTYTFQGIYKPTSFEAGNTSIRFLGSGNMFYYPTSTNPMRAFRCYFQLPTDVAAKLSNLDMAFDGGIDVATGIIAIGTDVSPQERAMGHIYSVSGQHVGTKAEGLPKGLYIRDGKKFVVK